MNRQYAAVALVACPKCLAPIGSPCTYLIVPKPARIRPYSSAYRRWLNNGRPTQNVHIERIYALDRVGRISLGRSGRKALAAVKEFDRREANRMRDWLREFGHILWDGSDGE